MNKIYFIIIPLVLVCCLLGSNPKLQTKNPKMEENMVLLQDKIKKKKMPENPYENMMQGLKCQSCHAGDYPNKNDPMLRACLRNSMLATFHFSPEGPDEVVIDAMSENYNGVAFSHKIHAQMSDMSTGCSGCHHYNTSGRLLSCLECHDSKRSREDITVPDLKAAYHRQCLTCHKQWFHENGCSTMCHTRKTSNSTGSVQSPPSVKGKTHPPLKEPMKMVWETNSETGKIVTFFHNEHNKIFNISCETCHKQDNCLKCHENKKHDDYSGTVKIKKSFENHHKACIDCHKGSSCQKCHRDSEREPFNHVQSSGWVLKSYHSQLSCAKCHGSQTPYKKLDRNCTSCHKNFITGNFEHGKAGLVLSENHKGMECISCHTGSDFSKTPECKTCHDDKSYPAQSPGKRGRK
ncbi:MAG: cytochrome c3 family protein [Ignavibacteria bacterium]|nr:cytochrome c3 family protein [Ignavibacteria bacterium]